MFVSVVAVLADRLGIARGPRGRVDILFFLFQLSVEAILTAAAATREMVSRDLLFWSDLASRLQLVA